MTRSEKDKMLAGEPYHASDPALCAEQAAAARWLVRYNGASSQPPDARHALLREGLGAAGEGTIVRPPFHCDYGWNIHVGARVFVNFGCVILDVARVEIGDDSRIGPNVQIYTAEHPRDPAVRRGGLESGRPVRIGANVWIGGGAIILPGVTIGDDAVVGAGSVVTHDVPAGAAVAGNPAAIMPPA
jgi:maltose O-acetyltransferase